MTTRVAFLRAVNLGRRRVSNSRLVEIFTDMGFDNVSAFINSGNVIFDAAGSRADLEARIGSRLESEFGFEVTTFVRTKTELQRLVANAPFTPRPGDTHYVTFLKKRPSAAAARSLEQLSNEFDSLVVAGHDVHWHMPGKSTDSHLRSKQWEDLVGKHNSTSRNITMLRRLVTKLG